MKPINELSHAQGRLINIDPAKSSLTIQGLILNKTFQTTTDASIASPTKPRAKLTDLELGEEVDVYYEEIGSLHIAHRVSQIRVPTHLKAA